MNSPYWYQIATASLVVLACCVASAFCFWYAVRQRNWLFHIVAVGTAVVVAGIVGERNVVQGTRRPGSVWDLSIKVPGLPLNVDQVDRRRPHHRPAGAQPGPVPGTCGAGGAALDAAARAPAGRGGLGLDEGGRGPHRYNAAAMNAAGFYVCAVLVVLSCAAAVGLRQPALSAAGAAAAADIGRPLSAGRGRGAARGARGRPAGRNPGGGGGGRTPGRLRPSGGSPAGLPLGVRAGGGGARPGGPGRCRAGGGHPMAPRWGAERAGRALPGPGAGHRRAARRRGGGGGGHGRGDRSRQRR